MVNKVFLDQTGLLHVQVIGDQTPETVREMGEKLGFYITDLRAQGRPVLILDDIFRLGHATSAARGEVARLTKILDFDRGAMVGGGSRALRYGTNLMLLAIGRSNTRYFTSPDAARRWLHDYHSASSHL